MNAPSAVMYKSRLKVHPWQHLTSLRVKTAEMTCWQRFEADATLFEMERSLGLNPFAARNAHGEQKAS
jgi:hypothetical protein